MYTHKIADQLMPLYATKCNEHKVRTAIVCNIYSISKHKGDPYTKKTRGVKFKIRGVKLIAHD